MAELPQYPRLAHLARALHEQGLALGSLFPSLQRIPENPFHVARVAHPPPQSTLIDTLIGTITSMNLLFFDRK
jgi:hypothetical protein